MSLSRQSRVAASLGAIAVFAGLLVLGAPSAVSLPQEGTNNYIGPAPCPPVGAPGDWDCIILDESTGFDIEGHVQKAPSGGRNVAVCVGGTCQVTQTGKTVTDKPANEASCTNATSAATSEQLCDIDQQGGSNEITANFSANPSTLDVNIANVDQRSEQRFITTQNGDTNALVVAGTISQSATSILDATSPASHTQRTLQRSYNQMNAKVHNAATYNLNRTQTSNATGATPMQFQDTPDPEGSDPEPDGATVGLGEINLVADSLGTNTVTVDGNDTKDQTGTSLLGDATQTQGYADGGWLVGIHVESAVDGPGLDIDGGEPGNNDDGLRKFWTQRAEVLPGSNKHQLMSDGIRLPWGSPSPFDNRSNSYCDLDSEDGAVVIANQTAFGHAKTNWTGRLACDLKAGGTVRNPQIGFSASDVVASLFCKLNNTVCDPGTEVGPKSHAHMAVRNVGAGDSFTGDDAPIAASGKPGETVEYKATFHNAGDPGSKAKNATLSVPVPAGTTFVGCGDPLDCPTSGNPVQSVTWSLGEVPGGSAVSRTAQVKVDDAAAPGPVATKATGDDDQEEPFTSNEVTLTIDEAPPPPVREIQIDVLESTINASKPKNGSTNVIINDTSVKPETVCFGDLPECTGGTSLGVGNFDSDPNLELKMKFLIRDTGIDRGDTQACLRGETTSGEFVHGCDAINTN